MLHYEGRFQFTASRREMWDAVSSIESFEQWAPWLHNLELDGAWLEPGTTVSFDVVSPLPFRLHIAVELTDVEELEHIEADVREDIVGSGALRARDSGTGTEVELTWDVNPRSRALQTFLRLSAPFVRWTQDWAVRAAVAGVRRKLPH